MKYQIQSLQSVLFLLFVVLGLNAFTNPNQSGQSDVIAYDIFEGKVNAVERNYKESLAPEFLQAQQDLNLMNIEFDRLAIESENNFQGLPQLSLMSQALYIYEQELKTAKFSAMKLDQKKMILSKLEAIKKEFYLAHATAISQEL